MSHMDIVQSLGANLTIYLLAMLTPSAGISTAGICRRRNARGLCVQDADGKQTSAVWMCRTCQAFKICVRHAYERDGDISG